jgi:hypothetical protein
MDRFVAWTFIGLLSFQFAFGQTELEELKSVHEKKVQFKIENLALYADFSLNQYSGRNRYVPVLNPQNGSSTYSGFERQIFSKGFEVNLSYDLVKKKGLYAAVGFGYRMYGREYVAVPDSIQIIKPGSTIRKYNEQVDLLEIPISVGYLVKDRIMLGLKVSMPMAYNIRVTSPDTRISNNPNWRSYDKVYLFKDYFTIEAQVGYIFQFSSVTLTPIFSIGGKPWSDRYYRMYYDFGLTIRYHKPDR